MNVINAFMHLPEIWERASEDGADKNKVFTCNNRSGWLVATVDDKVIGVVDIRRVSGVVAEFHPYVLSAHSRLGVRMVRMFLSWFQDHMHDDVIKLQAFIPDYVPGVYRAALRLGFQHEGTSRQCFKKHNIIYDMNLVGILRNEIDG
tara:strand:+ start:400 stop:840 length:441 start_codon:yes stop_codon:yes gene_type:complete